MIGGTVVVAAVCQTLEKLWTPDRVREHRPVFAATGA